MKKRIKKKRVEWAFLTFLKPDIVEPKQKKAKRNRHIYPVAQESHERAFNDGKHIRHKPRNLGFGEAGIYKGARVMKAQTETKTVRFTHMDGSHVHGDPSKVPYEPHGHISTSNSTRK